MATPLEIGLDRTPTAVGPLNFSLCDFSRLKGAGQQRLSSLSAQDWPLRAVGVTRPTASVELLRSPIERSGAL